MIETEPRVLELTPRLASIAELLFQEALNYNKFGDHLPRFGVHTTVKPILLDKVGLALIVHFRNIKSLVFDKPIRATIDFFNNLGNTDLPKVAEFWKDHPEFKRMFGLCCLSAKWGRRHGFSTVTISDEPHIKQMHEATIIGKPQVHPDEISPLTLFVISRDRFLQEFLS